MVRYASHQELKEIFPNLKTNHYSRNSPPTVRYNCIAFAAKETERNWWPADEAGAYWPNQDYSEDPSIQDFIDTFREEFGYSVCETRDHETGFEKVAIYAELDGSPTHMARQCESGEWCSKLGAMQDIKHDSLEDLKGEEYGQVAVILKRPIDDNGCEE